MQIAQRSRTWALSAIGVFVMMLSPAEAALRYLARSWQSEDGLPSNAVRAVAQAADGYLWVVTAEGVVRFDGQRFSPLAQDSGAATASRLLRSLFPLANGEVWVTTTSDVVLRGREGRLEHVALPPSANDDATLTPVSLIFLGEKGEVFAARDNELWQIADGKVITATRTAELERRLHQEIASEADRGRTMPGDSAVRLRTARGVLWEFSPRAGLTKTDAPDGAEPVLIQPEPPAGTRAMLEDREGNLWLGTATQGLWRLRPSRVEVLTTADGLSDRATLLVLEDRAGALWVAPQLGGLDRLSGAAAEHFDVQPAPMQRPVSALMETRAGVLWAAAREGKVYAWKDGAFSPAFGKVQWPGKIGTMTEDERGQIWLGGRFGLSVWDGSEPRRTIDFGGPEVVTALLAAGSTVWAGTESGKVFRGTNEKFEAIAAEGAFSSLPISSILPDADGSVWIGTIGAGLFHFRDGRVVALAPRMGVADLRITCVLDDGSGYLWLGTLGGICRLEKAKLLGSSAPVPGSILVLDRSDGLLTRECTRGGEPAGWRGRNGALYFSTGHGVARVHPGRIALNTVPPPVVIEGVVAGPHPLPMAHGRAQAGPGRHRLEFQYTAVSFSAPEKVRFRTRMEGLDESWRDAGDRRVAVYEAVPPGKYRFQVLAENGDGVWNETGAAFPIEVLPHFWETRWFRTVIAIVLTALAVGAGAMVMRARMRGRMLRLEAQTSREKERARIAQDLHDDLGASLTEISLLANLAAEERKPSPPAEEDTLSEVAVKAQALVGALDEIVWAVNPRHDTLRSLVEYLAAFGGQFLGRAGMTLRRDVPRDLPEVSLDAERRHHIFLAAREALNNTVKHSGASEVWLRVRLEAGELKIAIEDNGRGLPEMADELSEGLRGMRARMARIGGACQIAGDATGTRVCLSLPLPAR